MTTEIRHDPKYILKPSGASQIVFDNPDSKCWFNTFLHLLMHCTVLHQLILDYQLKESTIVDLWKKVLNELINGKKSIRPSKFRELITNIMVDGCVKQCKTFETKGQQSVPETFLLFLELLGDDIRKVVSNCYTIEGKCSQSHTHNRRENDCIIRHLDLPIEIDSVALGKKLISCESSGECPVCKSPMILKENLVRTSSCMVLTGLKQTFPRTFEIPTVGKNFKYVLVATAHHEGVVEGGHYYATVLRSNGDYVTINDNYIIRENKEPSEMANQIMAIYELLP